MTKRQANTLIVLGVAILLTQILCTVILLRGQEQMQKSNLAIQQVISGTDDPASTTRIEGGAAVTPGLNAPAPTVTPATPAPPTLRMVFPEEDICNARQRVEAAKSELRKATKELDKLTKGDD